MGACGQPGFGALEPAPIALPWNDLGHVWSGSAIADTTNASGLFGDSGGKGLIAYYTSFNPDRFGGNQKIGLAYSTDHGRTWTYSKERPILIENPGKQGEDPGGWDFRDPKVVRDEANNRWIMVVSGEIISASIPPTIWSIGP